jgi:hypothetical protein
MSETWDADQVAAYLGVRPATWRDYRSDGRGPEPVGAEIRDGRARQVWSADEVRAWHAGRSGRGWRGQGDS